MLQGASVTRAAVSPTAASSGNTAAAGRVGGEGGAARVGCPQGGAAGRERRLPSIVSIACGSRSPLVSTEAAPLASVVFAPSAGKFSTQVPRPSEAAAPAHCRGGSGGGGGGHQRGVGERLAAFNTLPGQLPNVKERRGSSGEPNNQSRKLLGRAEAGEPCKRDKRGSLHVGKPGRAAPQAAGRPGRSARAAYCNPFWIVVARL